jgi:two-component system nitrogen regulation response regulator GlnG
MTALCNFHWPGNVRQLENVCRWITVMASGQTVDPDQLPPEIIPVPDSGKADNWQRQLRTVVENKLRQGETDLLTTLSHSFERTLLAATMKHTGGHKQEAARRLGWGRNTLARKLKELGLN